MSKIYELNKLDSLSNIYNILEKNKKVNLVNVKSGLQSFITYLLYEQTEETGQDILYIVPSETEVRDKYNILRRFTDKVSVLSSDKMGFNIAEAFSFNDLQDREIALKNALTKEHTITICTLEALLRKLPEPQNYLNNSLKILKGESYDFDDIISTLTNYGYERVELTDSIGQFTVRGELIDVYPISEDSPVRIDFFDDEVETIAHFDPLTQRTTDQINKLELIPLIEDWLDDEDRQALINKLDEKYKNEEKYNERLEQIRENILFSNNILAIINDRNTYDFMEFLKYGSHGKNPFIVWASPDECIDLAKEYIEKYDSDYEALCEIGEVLPEEYKKNFTLNQLLEKINDYPLLKLHLFTKNTRNEKIVDLDSRIVPNFAGQPGIFADYIKGRIKQGYYIRFFVNSSESEKTIENFLKEYDIPLIKSENELIPGVRLSYGEITESFELVQDKVIFLNESDFFKKERRQRKKKNDTKSFERFTELKKGDLVVHDNYGIGRYIGLQQFDFGDNIRDMMKIQYAGDDVLYVPIEGMDSVQVYIGTGESEAPPLNELGSRKWKATKARVKKVADDIADELIKLYSTRQEIEGFSFSKDTVWQQQFEDAFPFEETDDQLQSIEEIKADMEKNTAMDRLLCGDVGFGKTEVALRAAFKAVMDNKQVALLVPTTILSQQHYLTALERFKDFPVKIEILNRFRKTGEIKDILKRLKEGDIDIIIGTHRLLSRDIEFKDLGLLIIDEEQRFGVKAKEKIKQLKANVDVLTLSATPIPRTLHMSLMDIRDMSVLEEPPSGRRPIQTYVMNYSPLVIKDAIEREINRNGQVYYIHNRVHDIDEVTKQLRKLVPNARIISAHGRMSGRELEDVMMRFLNKEYDVLVATTIVENGLDVRNANTMIVEDSDRYGLSQLYQLRGRVGRSDKQAYAYLTHKKEVITEEAQKRLKALRDFTAFGSGFKVAMRDLEIRGAGNILGKQQSGHMVKIGYELYNRILKQAIDKKLTGFTPQEMQEASVQSTQNAYVPGNYIIGDEVRYDIYKKISRLHDWEDFDILEEELIDRFGKIPQEVIDLMLVAMIKNVSTQLDIHQVKQSGKEIKLILNSKDAGNSFNQYIEESGVELNNLKQLSISRKPEITFELANDSELLKELYSDLNTIKETQEKLIGGRN